MEKIEMPKLPFMPIAFPIPPPFTKSTIGVHEIYITPIEVGYGFGITFPKELPEELKIFQSYSGKSVVVVYSKKALDAIISVSGSNTQPSKEVYETIVGEFLKKLKSLNGKDYQAKYFDESVLITVQGSNIVCKNERIIAGERLIFAEPFFPEPLKAALNIPLDAISKIFLMR